MLFAKLCVFLCLFSIKEDLFRCNLILKFDARFQHIFVRKCIFFFYLEFVVTRSKLFRWTIRYEFSIKNYSSIWKLLHVCSISLSSQRMIFISTEFNHKFKKLWLNKFLSCKLIVMEQQIFILFLLNLSFESQHISAVCLLIFVDVIVRHYHYN